jgi:hypothetical protein
MVICAGVALDYHRITIIQSQLQNISDKAVLAGGRICLTQQLSLGDTTFLDVNVKLNTEKTTKESFIHNIESLKPNLLSANIQSLSIEINYLPESLTPITNYPKCKITLKYTGFIKSLISNFLKLYKYNVSIVSVSESSLDYKNPLTVLSD